MLIVIDVCVSQPWPKKLLVVEEREEWLMQRLTLTESAKS